MNKQKILTGLVSLSILATPIMAFAAPPINNSLTLCSLVTAIENLVWIIFGLIAVISFVIAGVLFLTAGGNPEKVAQARTAFLWGAAGVVVGIIAFSIIAIIGSGLGIGVGSSC